MTKTTREASSKAWNNYKLKSFGGLYQDCFMDGFAIGVEWVIKELAKSVKF